LEQITGHLRGGAMKWQRVKRFENLADFDG
jgi:hypothetical protein